MRGVIILLAIAAAHGTSSAATVVRYGPMLCENDQQLSNGTCIEKMQNDCPAGYYETLIDASTYSAMTLKLQCMNSYNKEQLPDIFHAIYNGVLVAYGAKLCGNGQYLSDGECTAYQRGECPENFYDITGAEETLSIPENMSCASDYVSYGLNANCASGAVSNGLCAILCERDKTYTGLGTCATPCPHGITEMHAAGGHAWPLYAEKLTTPALNIKTSNGVCYINFLPGAARGVMNIKSATGTYHISD